MEESKIVEKDLQEKRDEFFILKDLFFKLDNEKKELERKNMQLSSQQEKILSQNKSTENSQMEILTDLREEIAALTIQVKWDSRVFLNKFS